MTHPNALRGSSDMKHFHGAVHEAADSYLDIVTNDVVFGPEGTLTLNAEARPGDQVAPLRALGATNRAHGQLATRAGVPTKFYNRIREDFTDLWANTMNTLVPSGNGLYRTMPDGDGGRMLRAALSDVYGFTDHRDVLTTTLKALTDAGLGMNEIRFSGDLDPENGGFNMKIVVPSIGIAAEELTRGYKSPWDGRTDHPMVFAGLEIRNNECGHGMVIVAGRAELEICSNGWSRLIDRFKSVHLGGKLEAGIKWSDETRQKRIDWIGSAIGDAVRQYISPEYLRLMVDEALVAKGVEVEDIPAAMAKLVTFADLTEAEGNQALNCFMDSGERSLLGMAQAVTAMAQLADTGERQAQLEDQFFAIVNQPQLVAV